MKAMDKKSDISLRAASPPSMRVTSQPTSQTTPRMPPPQAPASLPSPDDCELIFRYRSNEAGELEEQILPATLENLLNLEEEDKVTQSNPHFWTLNTIADILRRRLAGPGVGVFGDLRFYWDSPDSAVLHPSSPDVSVVFDMKRPAEEIGGSFNVAEEGTRPSLIIEVVSASYKDMREKDYIHNISHYAKAGVQELVFVEPETEGSLRIRRLALHRLGRSGRYREIGPNKEGRFELRTVGLTIHVEEAALVLSDAQTGERLLTSAEEEASRRTAEEALQTESKARQDAEAEIARLRALLEDQGT